MSLLIYLLIFSKSLKKRRIIVGNESQSQVKITTADPTALGLFSLAIVALVESTDELGLTEGLAFIVPGVFFLGGIAQLFAASLDARNNSIFGTTVWDYTEFFGSVMQ